MSRHVVCTQCPWRLRHEFPEHGGLVCQFHIERFDAAPAADVIAAWMKKHGFSDDALEWFPSQWLLGILQGIRSKMR